ncbi:MAG: tol-pal system protein YbgF [Burkholderiales bacterium]
MLLALVLCAANVHAGMFDDEEARKSIAATQARLDGLAKQLDARIVTLEQQSKQLGFDLLRDLEGIKSDIAKIRGQIEVLTYELNEQQKRQRDLYVDLDSRLRKMETGASPNPAGGMMAPVPPSMDMNSTTGAAPNPQATSASPPPPVNAAPQPMLPVTAQEQKVYDAALDQFKRGDYNGAIASFQGFVKTYPRSLLASSAQYWVGNAQFARKDYKTAIATQRTLIQTWPDSPKVPDALLSIASSQSEQGDNASARKTLEELIAKYPQSESAGKAKQRLGMR